MSYLLNNGTTPADLLVKTNILFGKSIFIGDYEITIPDFLRILCLVLHKSLLTQSKLLWPFWRYFNSIRTVRGYEYIVGGKKIRTFRLLTQLSVTNQIAKASAKTPESHKRAGINLSADSYPQNIVVQITTPMTEYIIIGSYRLSLYDFLFVMDYVFSNENLEKNDPRRKFLKNVKRWKCFYKYRNRT